MLAAQNAPCKISLSVEGDGSQSFSCGGELTLWQMLLQLVEEGKLSESMLDATAAPSIIYIRKAYSIEAMMTTTLGSLGLAG
jgi:hypothetical protein